ncbi:MAG: aminotransferase class IV [Flavobacteriaceae bacterium]
MISYNGVLFNHWSEAPLHQMSFSQLSKQFSLPVYWHNNQLVLLEATYFHMMSSLRRWRMEIPMSLTPEALEAQVGDLQKAIDDTTRTVFQISFFRETNSSLQQPMSRLGWIISPYGNFDIVPNGTPFKVTLYKDYGITPQSLSGLPAAHQQERDVARVFAYENDYQDCLLMNSNKNLVEATQGTLFLYAAGVVQSPDMKSGCRYSVLRTAFIEWLHKKAGIEVDEKPLAPFALPNSEAIGILNPYSGMQMVTSYRKKTYQDATLAELFRTFWKEQL